MMYHFIVIHHEDGRRQLNVIRTEPFKHMVVIKELR